MKLYLTVIALLISAFSLAQDSGSISGKLLDFESISEPLMFAEITVKETGDKTHTDKNGLFKFQNLDNGLYTLVISFVGYDTKEVKANVVSNQLTKFELFLKPSTISFEELMSALDNAESKGNTASINK